MDYYLAMFDFVVCVYVVWFKCPLNTRYLFIPDKLAALNNQRSLLVTV